MLGPSCLWRKHLRYWCCPLHQMGERFSVVSIRGEKIWTHSRGEILLRPSPFFGSCEPHGKLLYKGASSSRRAVFRSVPQNYGVWGPKNKLLRTAQSAWLTWNRPTSWGLLDDPTEGEAKIHSLRRRKKTERLAWWQQAAPQGKKWAGRSVLGIGPSSWLCCCPGREVYCLALGKRRKHHQGAPFLAMATKASS